MTTSQESSRRTYTDRVPGRRLTLMTPLSHYGSSPSGAAIPFLPVRRHHMIKTWAIPEQF